MLADPAAAAPAATGKSSSRRRLSHTAAADIEKVARASRGGARAGGVYFYQPRVATVCDALHGPVSTIHAPPAPPPQPTVPSPLCQLSSSSAAWKLSSAGPVMYSKLHLQPTDKSALCCASRKAVRMKIHRDVLPCQAAAEGQFLISLGRSKLRGSGSEFGFFVFLIFSQALFALLRNAWTLDCFVPLAGRPDAPPSSDLLTNFYYLPMGQRHSRGACGYIHEVAALAALH